MRDVISNETIKEINEVIDEILTNIDDNVRNIVGAGNYSLPTIFSYTNYSGQTINVHGSTFRHEIIIDNADGNNLIGDICTVIGDRKGIKLAKAGVEDRHDTFANYWDSSFDIAYDSDTAINGYVFDMHSGLVGEGTGQSKVMSFKLDNLKVGKAYTLTFRGKFVHAQFVSGQESLVRICSTTAETPYLAQVTLEKDTDAHIYRIDFINNTQNTTLYLNFWFYGVDYDIETYNPEFIADDLIIAGMNIGIISRYIDYNGKWYPIEAGGGTSDLDAIELTYAEYQALTPDEKTDPDKIYFITDYPASVGALNDLSDVDITTPTEGQILTYDDTDDEWKNTDVDDVAPAFTEASTRANIASGETFATLLGKIKKFFSDLKAVAFTGAYSDLSGTPSIPDVSTKYDSSDSAETTLADDDKIPFYDTSASGRRNSTWANIKAKLKAYFDEAYIKLSNSGAQTIQTTNGDTPLNLQSANNNYTYLVYKNPSGTSIGGFGVRLDKLPYFWNTSSEKRIALLDEVPTKLSDLTNDLNKIKDIGNGQDTTFAYSKAGLNYDDVSWLAAWNGYELRALDKNKLSIGYVPIRKDYDTYTQLAKYYSGSTGPAYIRIAFPAGIATVWTMLNIEILFRQNYANDLGGKILINCHHNQTSPYAWVGNATVYGFLRKSDIKVYGSDGHYLYIEGIDSYTTLSIEKVLVGDTARSVDFTDTTIDYVSALPSGYQTLTMYTDVDSSNIANQSVDKATKDGDGNTISSTYTKVRTTTDNANYNTALNISAYDATKPIFGYVSVITNLSAGANFYIPFSFMKDVVPAGTHNLMAVQGAFRFMFEFTDSPRSIKMVQALDGNGNDATTNNTIKFYLYRNY